MIDSLIILYVIIKNFFICRRRGLTITRNLEYGINSKQKYDIFTKDNLTRSENNLIRSKMPMVLFIHGGGWCSGDKATWEWYACEMAHKGYIAVSMNYRMAPEVSCKEMIDDVNKLIDIFNNKNTIVIGSSAGGHLTMWAGYNTKVKKIISYSGPSDLEFFLQNDENNILDAIELMEGLLDGEITTEKLQKVSPITFLDESTYYADSLIVHGHKDVVVSFQHAVLFNNACIRNDKKSKCLLLNKGPHGFEYFPKTKDAKQVWEQVVKFIEE